MMASAITRLKSRFGGTPDEGVVGAVVALEDVVDGRGVAVVDAEVEVDVAVSPAGGASGGVSGGV
jgi:hypothetical protein